MIGFGCIDKRGLNCNSFSITGKQRVGTSNDTHTYLEAYKK